MLIIWLYAGALSRENKITREAAVPHPAPSQQSTFSSVVFDSAELSRLLSIAILVAVSQYPI
jgi:hypothetical protein